MVDRSRQIHMTGLKDFRKMCKDIAPKQAKNLARSTVHGVAGQVRNEMRKKAPRDEGDLRKAIKSVRRSMQGNTAISDVRIEHGNRAKYDAWYWHFIEFGTLKQPEQPFIRPTVSEIEPQIPAIFEEQFAKRLEKKLSQIAKRQGVKS